MLILGHAGITLGAAVLLNGALVKSHLLPTTGNKAKHRKQSRVHQAQRLTPSGEASWFTSLGSRIDIRVLLIGSLLPDIIDKPVGQLLLRDSLNNGRIFCHTLLFLIIISLAGSYLCRSRGQNWLLVLSAGTFTHLVFDQLWLTPGTLFWPLYGFAFERLPDLATWARGTWQALLTEPAVYLPELTGAVILIWFAATLVRRKKTGSFLRNGQV